MFLLILGIIGLVAAGCIVAKIVMMTFKWIVDKIKQKMAEKNVNKTAVIDLEKMISQCENRKTMQDFQIYVDKGYTHIFAGADKHGNAVGEAELIKDKNNGIDREVDALLGRKGMVVIED